MRRDKLRRAHTLCNYEASSTDGVAEATKR
jgi:hypothetical protein